MTMRTARPLVSFAWALGSIALTAAIYAGSRAASGLSPFVVDAVSIEGAVRTDPEALLRAAGFAEGRGLFHIDVDTVREAVEALPWIRRARVVRRMPSSLKIEVTEWTPQYLVRLDRLYYATAEGRVVRAALDHGLDYPVITGFTWADLEGDAPLRASLLEVLRVVEHGFAGEEPSEIHWDPGLGFAVYTPTNGGTGIQLGFSNFGERLQRLERLRAHLSRRGQAAYAVNLTPEDKIIARLLRAEGEKTKP